LSNEPRVKKSASRWRELATVDKEKERPELQISRLKKVLGGTSRPKRGLNSSLIRQEALVQRWVRVRVRRRWAATHQ